VQPSAQRAAARPTRTGRLHDAACSSAIRELGSSLFLYTTDPMLMAGCCSFYEGGNTGKTAAFILVGDVPARAGYRRRHVLSPSAARNASVGRRGGMRA